MPAAAVIRPSMAPDNSLYEALPILRLGSAVSSVRRRPGERARKAVQVLSASRLMQVGLTAQVARLGDWVIGRLGDWGAWALGHSAPTAQSPSRPAAQYFQGKIPLDPGKNLPQPTILSAVLRSLKHRNFRLFTIGQSI